MAVSRVEASSELDITAATKDDEDMMINCIEAMMVIKESNEDDISMTWWQRW